jgi:predicted extracellular nuclease
MPSRRAPIARCLSSCLLALSALMTGCDSPTAQPGIANSPRNLGQLQGNGARSEFEGQRLQIQGVVTGNFVKALGGFYLQDAVGEEDGDPATSDALFVAWPRDAQPTVRRGDRVHVNAVVREVGSGEQTQTQLQDAQIEVLGRAAAKAVVLSAPPANAADWERFENMWVRIDSPLSVTGNDGLLRYGELSVAFGTRLTAPTEAHPPGPEARALQADNARRSLTLDDARRSEYPEKLWFLPAVPSAEEPLRAGSLLSGVEGVLESRPWGWALQLTEALHVQSQAPRPAPPAPPNGLRVASFNVLNYFNGNGRGGDFPTERGARTAAELQRQRGKIITAITALQADIVALLEIENDGDGKHSAIAELVAALNQSLGDAGDYDWVRVGKDSGSDAIRVALIYRRQNVQMLGEPAVLKAAPFDDLHRVPLAQTFASTKNLQAFTVIANHWKSKGGCEEAEGGNRDQGDGQGCWNAARVEAARALDRWIASDPTAAGNARHLVIGDLNSYSQEDPLRLLRNAGWVDGHSRGSESASHSFVFRGLRGRLDHAFLSPSLANDLASAQVWSINADESEVFGYAHVKQVDPENAVFRSSDHDPLVLDLRIGTP